MKLQKILSNFQKLHPKEIDLSLDRIKNLCEKLGNPQDKIKAISVVGTNGKQSTINAIFSILKEMCSDGSIALDFFFYGDNRFAVSNRLVDIFYLKDEVLDMIKTYPDLSRKQAQSLADQFEVYGWNDPEHKDEEARWKPVIITARNDQDILLGAAVVLTQLPAFTSYGEFKNSMNCLLGKASYAPSLKSRIQQVVLKKCHSCEIPKRRSGDYLRDFWNQFNFLL